MYPNQTKLHRMLSLQEEKCVKDYAQWDGSAG
jgi:hypothetical protein